ncbi:MAG: DUF4870 family protein [Brevundimonas sp.]|jgi:uncharacterized membrane protein|uniref:DUF4870 family protein n=1 Tax=Brevundimonas sp. TaxID=1871086 RepID=UPI00391AB6D1
MSKPDELTSDAREPAGERVQEAAPESLTAGDARSGDAPPLDDDALAFDEQVGFCSAHSLSARPAQAARHDGAQLEGDAALFAGDGGPQDGALEAISGAGLEVRPEPVSEPVSFMVPQAPEPEVPAPAHLMPESSGPESPESEVLAPESVHASAAAAVVQNARAQIAGNDVASTRDAPARAEPIRSGKGHDLSEESRGETVPLFASYALAIGAIPTLGVGLVLGLIVAWLFRGGATPWLQTHYTYLIRTLIAAVIVGLVAVILLLVGIGIFIAFVLALWMLARGIHGALRLSAGQPIRDPRSWLF